MKNKLDLLRNKANIGIYNKCEVIEIFGFNKEKKEAFNIYTLVVFENTQKMKISGLMTEKLCSFKGYKNISWGIKRRIIDIEGIENLYNILLEKNIYEIDKPLKIGSLDLMVEQYIPPIESMNKDIPLNNILKNNFHNGSYILEFFDKEKHNVEFLLDNPPLLNEFSEFVSSVLPIKIGTLSDRLGNIIFQLPINSFHLIYEPIVDRETSKPKFIGFKVEILPKKENFNIKNLLIRFYEEDSDKVIARHKIVEVTDTITDVKFDDSFGTYLEIIDKTTQLLLYRYRSFIMKQMDFGLGMIEHQKRVFEIDKGAEKLEVTHNTSANTYGKDKEKHSHVWIINRQYEEELRELEKSKSFIQYFGNQEDKALNDIRELIKKYGDKGVYLWDPYLDAIDIKNTLYFCKIANVPLKAISGLKQESKEQSKKTMIHEFEKDNKDFLFLNLEVRGRIGLHGYDFHDRFLIFPSEKPKVWSLGISVNQLGASHHILQEVKNAQHIVNAFNRLWNELNNEECLVWKIS